MDASQLNQIERYLSGQMSPDEISKFESLAEVNPELQQQLQFQSEIIDGIGNFRKAELKARLEGLDPTPAWWTIAQLTPIGQFIGGGILVTMLGVGGFWLADQGGEAVSNPIEVTAPTEEVFVWDFPEIESPSIEDLESIALEESDPIVDEKEVVIEEAEIFDPVVSVPNAGDVESERDFEPEDLPTPEELNEEKPVESAIDVEIIDSKAAKIKYRYYAGKLYLYGKFQDEPYQILEINSASGRRVYLFHKEIFYSIVPSDKPLALDQVTDRQLIRELSILQKTK